MKRHQLMLHIGLYLLIGAASLSAQRRPDLGNRPNPGPNKIEVRFASGEQTAPCKSFSLRVESDGKVLINGEFSSSFLLPADLPEISFDRKVKVTLGCGKHRWNFKKVPSGALRQGWWWVGTDYPPFQSEFGGEKFAKCRIIHYLIVDPTGGGAFDYFETTPRTLEGSREACTGK